MKCHNHKLNFLFFVLKTVLNLVNIENSQQVYVTIILKLRNKRGNITKHKKTLLKRGLVRELSTPRYNKGLGGKRVELVIIGQ